MAKRRSKYKRVPPTELSPIRLYKKDLQIFELLRPGNLPYATSQMLAAVCQRNHNRLQQRLRQLFDNGYVFQYPPPHNKVGGSSKLVYLLDERGADELSDHLNEPVEPLDFDPESYHQQLPHTLTTLWFSALVKAACQGHPEIELLYEYHDHHFKLDFTVDHDGKTLTAKLRPDYFFGIRRDGSVRNFWCEITRSSRKTKQNIRGRVRSIRSKLRDYFLFYKTKGYEQEKIRELYPDVQNLKNTRVLLITDSSVGDREHENLIKLARGVDPQKVGLRLFWTAKISDFDITKPETLFAPVWRTPRLDDDQLWSILQ